MRDFAKIASPLHVLTGKTQEKAGKANTPLVWSTEADLAFTTLKKALCEAPVLSYPCFGHDFVLEIDASAKGLRACLCQADDDGKLHPVAYASRGLRGAEKNYTELSSFKLEFLALKWAVSEKFRDYLLGHHTIVWTDHNPLSHLKTAKLGATEQRWMAQLAPFDIEIKYRSGKSNRCADALSRYPYDTDKVVSEAQQCNLSVEGTQIPVQLRSIQVSQTLLEKGSNDIPVPDECTGSWSTVFPSFSHAELALLQQEDKALKVVWSCWKRRWEPGQEMNDNEPLTPEAKSWLKEWHRLIEGKGVLYRSISWTGNSLSASCSAQTSPNDHRGSP